MPWCWRPAEIELVKRVVAGDGTEQRDIALAEVRAHLRRQRHLAHGKELEGLAAPFASLRAGIEGAELLQSVAEEIEADRFAARRVEIENAAAHGILPGVCDGAGAGIAGNLQASDQFLHADDVAGLKLEARRRYEVLRRDPLHDGVDGRENDERRFRIGRAGGERRKRGDAPRDGLGVGSHAVVRNAVPGGEAEHFDVGREEAERFFQRGEARAVARDMQDGHAGSSAASGEFPEEERIEPFGHASGDGTRRLKQALDGEVRKFRRS